MATRRLMEVYRKWKRRAEGARVAHSTLIHFNDERYNTVQVLNLFLPTEIQDPFSRDLGT